MPNHVYLIAVPDTKDGKAEILVITKPMLEMVNSSWKKSLCVDAQDSELKLFRKHERTGLSIGGDVFIERMERLLDWRLKPQKPGPKVKV